MQSQDWTPLSPIELSLVDLDVRDFSLKRVVPEVDHLADKPDCSDEQNEPRYLGQRDRPEHEYENGGKPHSEQDCYPITHTFFPSVPFPSSSLLMSTLPDQQPSRKRPGHLPLGLKN